MGLSRGITVHCGTSFANERHMRNSLCRVGSPKPCKVKLNKSRQQLLQAQQEHNERMACMCLTLLSMVHADPTTIYSVKLSGMTRPARLE